jgi:predicted nucleotidyltransferase
MRRRSLSVVEECYRGSQVRVFRLRRQAILQALEEAAHRLLAERPEVLEVRMFGSLAKGNAGPGSDADILLVLSESNKPFVDRIPEYARFMTAIGIACDIFPYTRAEFAQLRAEGNHFAETICSESRVLASREASGALL